MILSSYPSWLRTSAMCLTCDNHELSHFEQVELLLTNGAKLIQLRCKLGQLEGFIEEAKRSVALARKYGATIIINDFPHLAKEVLAAGVHLGKNDGSLAEARTLMGEGFLIGRTVHSINEAIACKSEMPDYVGVGPFRHSKTKVNLSPSLSKDQFSEIFSILHPIPIFLIGGLTADDFPLIDDFGITGLALCSALWSQKSYRKNISEISKLFNYSHASC